MKEKIRLLWVVNVPLPEASALFDIDYQPYAGWLIELSKRVSQNELIELHIAFPSYSVQSKSILSDSGIVYHSVNKKRFFGKNNFKNSWHLLLDTIVPNLVNIYGTEYEHSGIVSDYCYDNKIKTVVTIQGIPSYISRHIRADLPNTTYYGFTLRNLLLRDSVYLTKKKFEKTGIREKKTILQSGNVIGRTSWDKACLEALNPDVNYFHCEETLRPSFLEKEWDINNIDRHSIFFSQGQYSLKGLHFILNEMPNILSNYPNAILYVAGVDITNLKNLKKKLLKHYYYLYIRKIISKNEISSHVIFTGPLNEEQMSDRYLKSHVFLSSSTIENSPNSVAESLAIGTPTIASYVGGVPDMIKNGINGLLYQGDAPYLIPSKIRMIFEDDKMAQILSKESRELSLKINNYEKIAERAMNIYFEIIDA